MEPHIINAAIDRIRQMEAIFDKLQLSAAEEISVTDTPALQLLIQYYEGNLWRHDYELDECGYLPADLKRGVLSEDGVYNFLTQIRENIP